MGRRMYLIGILVASAAIFSGCASSSGVFMSGKDTYTVVITGRGVNMGGLMKQAYEEAESFCKERSKAMQPVSTTSKPFVPYGGDPYYELTFRALDPSDPEYRRPTLEKEPDTTIELRNN